MTRLCLALVVLAAAAVGCNAIVGVEPLTLEPVDAASEASGYDAALDATKESDGSRDVHTKPPNSDATVASDDGTADSPTDDAAADAEESDAYVVEAGATPDGGDGGNDAGDGGDSGESGMDAAVDAADAGPSPDAGSALDGGSDADDDAG
jgi:hypothetical protein